MTHLYYNNVNDAFRGIIASIHTGKLDVREEPSRNGSVLRVGEPVTLTYSRPLERVLFNTARDANPFFHLYEALWMLAGRNDVAPIAYYNSNMATYSDDGNTLNGAYGYRWRRALYKEVPVYPEGDIGPPVSRPRYVDQLNVLVDHLTRLPHSRRAVLAMWNVGDDLLKIGGGKKPFGVHEYADPGSKDVCCNLNVMFEVETGKCRACNGTGRTMQVTHPGAVGGFEEYACGVCKGLPHDVPHYLNMTVTNRSNDGLWGLLGANYVHFSFLQEYMAARLGLEVGVYHHFTNNLHFYNNRWKPEEWLASVENGAWYEQGRFQQTPYKPFPLVSDPERFEKELPEFVELFKGGDEEPPVRRGGGWKEPFFGQVASPMLRAFCRHKLRDYDGAFAWMNHVEATDWKVAGTEWLQRRAAKYEADGPNYAKVNDDDA